MVDEVDIKNVGGKYGVASEATLAALVDAMTRSSGGSARAARAEVLARESNAQSIKRETGERTLLGKASGATIEPLGRLVKEFVVGGNRMGDFTQAVFGAQSNITSLVRSLDNTIDTFREMTSVGAGFNNSIYDFVKTSALTGMSLSDFSEFIIKNSTSMIGLGGTVTEGAKRFGDISKNLRTNFGPELTRIGMSMSEMNEVLLEYTEFSIGRMGRETRSNKQLAAGAATYSLELDKLSKLTGISRKQLAAEQQRQLADQRVRVAMASMTEQEQINMSNGLTYADTYSRTLGDSLRDMIDNIPDNDDTKGLMIMSETFRSQAANIKNMTAEQMAEFTSAVGNEIDAFSDVNPVEQLMKNSFFANTLGIGAELRKVTDLTAEQRKKMLEEQAAYDRLSAAFLNFETALNNLITFITTKIIESPAFIELEKLGVQISDSFATLFGSEATPGSAKNASSSFEKLTESLIGPEGLITAGIKALQTELTTFTGYIKTGGSPMDYFIQRVGDLGAAMSIWFKEIFYGKEVTGRDRQGTEHQKGLLAQMGDGMVSAFKSFWEGPIGTALSDTIGGYFKELVDKIILGINNATGGMFFGGVASTILTEKAQSGEVLTPEEKSVVAEQQYEDRTSLLGEATNATVESLLFGVDLFGDALYSAVDALGGPEMDANLAGMFNSWTRGTPDIPNQNSEDTSIAEPPGGVVLDPSAGFANGTRGFENFGSVTGTSLHGVEAVVPRNTMAGNMLAKAFGDDWNSPKANIQGQGSQENTTKYIIQLNSTMLMVLDELRKGTDLEKRTLNSVRSLSGDLNRGI